jgi:hypothetical protein
MKTGHILGGALITGSAAAVLTMALHPTGGDPSRYAGAIAERIPLTQTAHGLGIAGVLLLAIGFAGFSQRLGLHRASAIAGLVLYAFAGMAAVCAMVLSGFVSGDVIWAYREAAPTDQGALRQLFFYGGWLTDAYTRVFVAGSGAALAAWSLGLLSVKRLTGLAWFGLAVGVGEIALLAAGMSVFNLHGLGALVLFQAIWSVAVGVVLLRRPEWSAAEGGAAA